MGENSSIALSEKMLELKKNSRITKIVSRRTIRDQGGEKTLELTQEFEGTHADAEFAALILSMQTDMAVLRQAYAGGLISVVRFKDQYASMKSQYGKLITELSGEEL